MNFFFFTICLTTTRKNCSRKHREGKGRTQQRFATEINRNKIITGDSKIVLENEKSITQIGQIEVIVVVYCDLELVF